MRTWQKGSAPNILDILDANGHTKRVKRQLQRYDAVGSESESDVAQEQISTGGVEWGGPHQSRHDLGGAPGISSVFDLFSKHIEIHVFNSKS